MTTILVIDDDVVLLASVGLQLENARYTVFKASEIGHAELLFTEERPDLVLLEVRIGRDAGWDLLERFASQTTVIVLSASGREEDVIRGLNAGAMDYIAKPYRSGELLTRIQLRLKTANQRAVAVAPTPLPTEHAVSTPHGTHDAITDAGPAVEAHTELQVAQEYEQAQTTTGSPEQPDTDPDSVVAPDQVPIQATNANEQTPDLAPDDLSSPATVASSPTPHYADQLVAYTEQRPPSRQDPVFMTESEELALLRNAEQMASTAPDMLAPELPLGQRLHKERLRRRVTLVQAESELHIRMWYLQAMEEEKFALLPRGPLASEMLRSYATYLGLDAETTLEEYQRLHYTAPVEPPASLGSLRKMNNTRLVRWGVWIAAVMLALTVSSAGIFFFDPGGVNALSSSLRGLIVAPTTTRMPTMTATAAPTSTPTAMPTETPTPEPPPPPSPPRPEGEPPPEGDVPPEGEPPPEGDVLPVER